MIYEYHIRARLWLVYGMVIARHTGRMDALRAAVLPLVRATARAPDAACVIFLELPEADPIQI